MSAYVTRVHRLCDDGQPDFLPAIAQDAQAVFAEALEVVGRCARLERAAAQDVRSGVPRGDRRFEEALLLLDGARSRNNRQLVAADGGVPHLHDRVAGA